MAEIKKIYDDAERTTQIYPKTHERAVVDNNGTTAETKFQMITDLVNQKQMEVGAVPSDLTPTAGSTNWVTSDGVYNLERKALPFNTIDVSSFPILTGGLGSGTTWLDGTNFNRKGTYIPVKEGDVCQLSVSGNASNYAYMANYETPVANGTMPLVSGTTRQSIADGATVTVTAPTGTKFIYLQTDYNNGNTLVWTFKYAPNSLSETDAMNVYKKIDVSGLTLYYSYVYGATNKWTDGGTTNGGVFIPITPNKTYKIFTPNDAMDFSILQNNTITIGSIPSYATGYSSRAVSTEGKYYIFTAPSDAAYVFAHTLNTNLKLFEFYELVSISDAITNADEEEQEYGIVDLSIYPLMLAAIGADRWYNENRFGKFVPVQSGYCFKITQNKRTFNYAFLTTDVVSVGSNPSYAEGCERMVLVLNASCYVCAPNDAKYLFLQTNYNGEDATPTLERVGSAEYSSAVGKLKLGIQAFQDGIVVSKSEYKFAFSPSIGLASNNGVYVTYSGNTNTTDGDTANHNNVMASALWDEIDGVTKSELQPITTYLDSDGNALPNGTKWRNGMHIKYGDSMGAFSCISVANASDYSFGYNHSLEETTMTQCKLSYNDGTAKLVEFTGNNYRQMLVDMGFRDAYVASGTYNIDNQSIILYNGTYYIVLCTYVRGVNNKYPLVLLSSTDLATWTVEKMLGTSLHSASEIKFTINGGKIYLIYRNQTSATQGDGIQGYFFCCYNMSDGSTVYEIDNRSIIMALPAAFTFNGKSYLGCMNRPYNLSTNVTLTYPYYRQQFDFYEANESGINYKFSLYNPTGLNYPVFLVIPANTSYATTPFDRLYVAFSEDRRNLNFRQIGNVTLANITSLFV